MDLSLEYWEVLVRVESLELFWLTVLTIYLEIICKNLLVNGQIFILFKWTSRLKYDIIISWDFLISSIKF